MDTYLSRYFNVTLCPIGCFGSLAASLAINPINAFLRGVSFIAYLRQFDVVISFSLLPNLISSLASRYSIISLTGSPFFALDHSFLARLYWSFILQPISCLMADAIVPTSPSVHSPYLKFFPFLRSKVQLIHGFIDTHRIDECLASGAVDFVNLDFPYILFLANLSRQKGILHLIKIFSLIKLFDPSSDLKLIVCGDGPMLDRCLAQCTTLDLKVSFSPQTVRSSFDVFFATGVLMPYHYIAQSQLVVCPFYFEGLSNTILESLYLKKPVLAAYNSSTVYLQQLFSRNSSDDLKYGGSPLNLLPFPSKKNYFYWASALVALTRKSFRPPDKYMDTIMELSASVNIHKWKQVIDLIH